MKKILTLIALLAGTTLVYGQGTVVFSTDGGTVTGNYTNMTLSIYAGGFGALGTAGAGGGLALGTIPPPGIPNGYYYTMLIDTTTPTSANPLTGGWTQAYNNATGLPLMATNNNIGPGGMLGPNGVGYTHLQNEAAGTQLYFELIGWSADLGTTWAQVSDEMYNYWSPASILADTGSALDPNQNYFFGGAISQGEITLGAANGIDAALLYGGNGLATGQLGALTMDLILIPEPGTLTLMGLGGLSLLLFRRRK